MSFRLIFPLTAVAMLLGGSQASIAAVFAPSADARMLSLGPTTPHGTGTYLSVYSKTGNMQRTLIAFDLGSLPTGKTIQSATLTLTVRRIARYDNPNSLPMDVYRVTTPWSETEVTWENSMSGVPWNDTSMHDSVGMSVPEVGETNSKDGDCRHDDEPTTYVSRWTRSPIGRGKPVSPETETLAPD